MQLRTSSDRVRTANEEPVNRALERLRDDLRPPVHYRDIDVQFIEPPVDGRALAREVAHGARAAGRGAILTLVDQPAVSKVRVQWDCDGRNLLVDILIDVRDDGSGEFSIDSAHLQPLAQRVLVRDGELSLHATVGRTRRCQWCCRLSAESMGISENTVKFHVSEIFRKLGFGSWAEAVALVSERRTPFVWRRALTLVPSAGFEPATKRLEGSCSIP